MNSSDFQAFNKSLWANGKRLTDAKYKFYDRVRFFDRAYRSIEEANLEIVFNQRSTQTVLINSTGSYSETTGLITGGDEVEFWWHNGTANENLVKKTQEVTTFKPIPFAITANGTTGIDRFIFTLPFQIPSTAKASDFSFSLNTDSLINMGNFKVIEIVNGFPTLLDETYNENGDSILHGHYFGELVKPIQNGRIHNEIFSNTFN